MLTTMLHQMHVRCLQGAKNRTETQDSCFCRHVEAQRNNLAPNRWRTTGCQATRQSIRFIFRNHARSVPPGEIRCYQHIKSMNSWEFILNNIKIFPAVEVKKKKISSRNFPSSDQEEHHRDGTKNQEPLVLLARGVALFSLFSRKEKKHVAVWWPSPVWNVAAPPNTTRTSHSDRDSPGKKRRGEEFLPTDGAREHVGRHVAPLIRFTVFLNAPPC